MGDEPMTLVEQFDVLLAISLALAYHLTPAQRRAAAQHLRQYADLVGKSGARREGILQIASTLEIPPPPLGPPSDV